MDILFNKIEKRHKTRLLKELEANTYSYKKNNIALSSVKQYNIVCVLISGRLQIIKNDYEGNRIIIEDLTEGAVFGTITSSIANPEYDIYAKEDSKIIVIDFNEIINFNEYKSSYYNQFLKNLLLIMSDKIKSNNERIEILTNKTIRDKLLTYFRMNTNGGNNRVLYLPFTLTDLADYLAVNRSAMSRELRNLKDEGFIDIKGRRIRLLYDIRIN